MQGYCPCISLEDARGIQLLEWWGEEAAEKSNFSSVIRVFLNTGHYKNAVELQCITMSSTNTVEYILLAIAKE